MFYLFFLLITSALIVPQYAFPAYNGQDVTRTVTRVDARVKIQNGVTKALGKEIVATARADAQVPLIDGWELGSRIDIPYAWFDCPHNAKNCDSPYCYKSQCLDDSLLQVVLITPNYGRWAFGAGVKLIFPTAGDNLEIGQGKYQVLPSVAFRQFLNEWHEDSYWGMILRHGFDYAGYASAPKISQTFIQPFINIGLPDNWFINSSPEIIYNWETSAWFIPFDLMVGKMIGTRCILSVEYESGIVQDYHKYNQKVEFRIGYFY